MSYKDIRKVYNTRMSGKDTIQGCLVRIPYEDVR